MTEPLPAPYNDRVVRLRQALTESGLDHLLVTSRTNVRYLTGFGGTAGWVLVSDATVTLITDARYIEQVRRDLGESCARLADAGLSAALAAQLSSCDARTLGFESEHLSFASVKALEASIRGYGARCELSPTDGIVEGLRLYKDVDELDSIRRAAELADGAIAHAAEVVTPGMTEKDLAWRLERWLREHGSGPVPFSIIVASGPQSALPHATPGDRPFAEGEPIVIDLGATWGGYCSDITRTFFLGRMNQPFDSIYRTVLAAHAAALEGARTDMPLTAVDELARGIIRAAGLGDCFTHGLGHGVGLDIHERPTISARCAEVLQDHMVYTVEPGIYLPGQGGVRIEDTVVMLGGIPRSLARSSKADPVI